MKKLILLALLLCSFILFACGGSDDQTETDGDTDNDTTEEEIELEDNEAYITYENGGELAFTLSNGDKVTLTVPEEAVAENVIISFEELDSEPALTYGQVVSKGFRLLPDGLDFYQPVAITINHSTPFTDQDQVYLAYLDPENDTSFASFKPSTDKTEAIVFHFSDYNPAKMTNEDIEKMCADALEYKGSNKCRYNLNKRNNLAICYSYYHDNSPETAQNYYDKVTEIYRESFEKTLKEPMPEDDYCGRPNSKAGQLALDIYQCKYDPGNSNVSAMLDENFTNEVDKAWAKYFTDLAQKWIDTTPIEGDSCVEGRAKRWMDEYYCIINSGKDNIDDKVIHEEFWHGYAAIVNEFLQISIPGDEKQKCGWYKNCLDRHKSREPIFAGDEFGDAVLQDLDARIEKIESECGNLWNIKLSIDVFDVYEFSGMDGYSADYTVDIEIKEVEFKFDSENDLQIASGNVDAGKGKSENDIDDNGENLSLPFKVYVNGNGVEGTIVQNSWYYDFEDVTSWDVTDNGSEYNCMMEFACGSVTDFETRKHDNDNYNSGYTWNPKVEMVMFSTLPSKTLQWGVSELPKGTTYLRWHIGQIVDLCTNDPEDGGWSCESPSTTHFSNPHPSDERVVSDSTAPDWNYFNAKLSASDLDKLKSRTQLVITGSLSNETDVNDGAITYDTDESFTMTLTPVKK